MIAAAPDFHWGSAARVGGLYRERINRPIEERLTRRVEDVHRIHLKIPAANKKRQSNWL